MDPITIIGVVITVAGYVYEYKSSQENQKKSHEELEQLLEAQRQAYMTIARQLYACMLYELRKTELDQIGACIETVQEVLGSTMDVVPPPDVATAGDLSSAENLALLAVHDCNALQKELQADALTGIPEDGVRELLISALTAEADIGLLRCACLHRWEVLGAPNQADEKVATLNDLLDGCAIASATLRSYTNRRVTFISRQRHDHSTDDPGRQSPLWDYGYVDDGRVVWMFRDVFPDEIAKALQKVEAQITSLRQAHFLDDPDVQAVQKLEHTLQAQARPHNWIAQKLPNAGSVYNTPNQRRMAARGRFAIAASVNSRMAPQGVPEVKIP